MLRVTTVLLAMATASVLVGCGGHGDRDRVQLAPDTGQFTQLTRADALPEGHPPVERYRRALPEGHPPVTGYGHGLPEGHPVCPAGRQLLERGVQGGGSDDAGPRLIST